MSGTLCTKGHDIDKKTDAWASAPSQSFSSRAMDLSPPPQVAYQQEPWENQSSGNWSWDRNLSTSRKANPSAPLNTEKKKSCPVYFSTSPTSLQTYHFPRVLVLRILVKEQDFIFVLEVKRCVCRGRVGGGEREPQVSGVGRTFYGWLPLFV